MKIHEWCVKIRNDSNKFEFLRFFFCLKHRNSISQNGISSFWEIYKFALKMDRMVQICKLQFSFISLLLRPSQRQKSLHKGRYSQGCQRHLVTLNQRSMIEGSHFCINSFSEAIRIIQVVSHFSTFHKRLATNWFNLERQRGWVLEQFDSADLYHCCRRKATHHQSGWRLCIANRWILCK